MKDINAARNLLLALIYPVTADDMSESQAEEFELAVSEQFDYASTYSGNIKTESVGDVSISYDVPTSGRAPLRYYGQPISPSVVGRLTRCALLRRWV